MSAIPVYDLFEGALLNIFHTALYIDEIISPYHISTMSKRKDYSLMFMRPFFALRFF
jgi:hypothetical protein